jgi:hypothetical protein
VIVAVDKARQMRPLLEEVSQSQAAALHVFAHATAAAAFPRPCVRFSSLKNICSLTSTPVFVLCFVMLL